MKDTTHEQVFFIEGYGYLTQEEINQINGCGCRMTDFCPTCNPEEWEKLCQKPPKKS